MNARLVTVAMSTVVVMSMPATARGTDALTDGSPEPAGVGLATDQPCAPIRPVDALAPAGVGLPALERMVLDPSTLGTEGPEWTPDIWNGGYTDDAELVFMGSIAADGVCHVLERTGRLTGYAGAWERYGEDDTYASRASAVHLFGTADGAAAFLDWLPDALEVMPRTGGGILERASRTRVPDLGDGGIVLDLRTNTGRQRYAWFRDGSIVGVVSETTSTGVEPGLDLRDAAADLATRVADREIGSPDATTVLSMGLPRSSWGALGEGLAWDWYFGGCWDRREAAGQSSATPSEEEQALASMAQHGWLLRCSAMYSPPDGGTSSPPGLVRVATNTVLFEDTEGAAAYWSETLERTAAESGDALERFAVPGMPDAVGLRRPVPGAEYTDTRVTFQRGAALLTVFVHDQQADRDHRDQVAALAAALAARADLLLGVP